MPDMLLSRGYMVTIDDDDIDLVEGVSWHLWRRKERQQAILVRDIMAKKRRYRLLLHREIAFRMRPDLIRKADLVSVAPANGNYLDVRRDNLEITVRPRKHGIVRRPRGHRVGAKASSLCVAPPPAWSKDGCRNPVGGGDGRPGAEADPASERG